MSQGIVQDARDRAAHRKYVAAKSKLLTPPVTYTNATTEGRYTGNNMGSPREGANERTHASLPMGAQIEVMSV